MPSSPAAVVFESESEDATRAFGNRLGKLLRAGDVVLLSGELGTGKTRLTQGIGLGLGCPGPITSPTFVLVNEHRGREVLFHADLYRIASPSEHGTLGLWDEAECGVLVVEWPEQVESDLPKDGLIIVLTPGLDIDNRTLRLCPRGPRGREILDSLELT